MKESRIAKDKEVLSKISQLIDNIDNKQNKEFIGALKEIGTNASMISFCNEDKNRDYIRNKYGLIGSKSDFEVYNGIEFFHLEILKYIEEPYDAVALYYRDNIVKNLQLVKSKIDDALKYEETSKQHSEIKESFKRSQEPQDFKNFAKIVYSHKALERVVEELESLKTLDLLSREGRYCFARKIAIIGEFSRELEDLKLIPKNNTLFSFVKELRNKIGHFPTPVILKDAERLKKFEGIKEVLSEDFLDVVKPYLEAIKKSIFPPFPPYQNPSEEQLSEEKRMKLDDLKEGFSPKKEKRSNSQTDVEKVAPEQAGTDNNEKLLMRISQLTIDYYKIDDQQLAHEAKESMKEKAKNIIKNLVLKYKASQDEDNKFPDGDLPTEQELTEIGRRISTPENCLGILQRLSNIVVKYEVAQEVLNVIRTDDEQGVRKQKKEQVLTYIKSIDSLLVYYENLRQNLSGEAGLPSLPQDRMLISSDFNSVRNSFAEEKVKNPEEKRLRIINLIYKITQEIEFLQSINIQKPEGIYIAQYSLAIIGQYFKDIEEVGKGLSNNPVTEATKRAVGLRESVGHTIRAKNKSIAHEIFSFDQSSFLDTLSTHTLSMKNDVKALDNILSSPYAESDRQALGVSNYGLLSVFNNLAISHLRIGNFLEAVDNIKKAIEILDSIIFLDEGNRQDYTNHKLAILVNYSAVLIQGAKYEEALEILSRIKELELEILGDVSDDTVANIGFVMSHLGMYEESEVALSGAKNNIMALLNKVSTLERSGKVDDAKQLLASIDKKLEDLEANGEELKYLKVKFYVKLHKVNHSIYNEDYLDADSLLKDAKEFLLSNEAELRTQLGNRFFDEKRKLLNAQVACVVEKNLYDKDLYDELFNDIRAFNAKAACLGYQVDTESVFQFGVLLSNHAMAITDDPSLSVELLKKVQEIQDDYGFSQEITLLNLGINYIHLHKKTGDQKYLDSAKSYIDSSVGLASEEDFKLFGRVYEAYGCLYEALGQKDKARECLGCSKENYDLSGDFESSQEVEEYAQRITSGYEDGFVVQVIFQAIERKVINSFSSCKGKEPDNISIKCKIKDAQLYCKKELGLEEYDVEDIGDNECSIELNPSVREILKSKVKQSEQSV